MRCFTLLFASALALSACATTQHAASDQERPTAAGVWAALVAMVSADDPAPAAEVTGQTAAPKGEFKGRRGYKEESPQRLP